MASVGGVEAEPHLPNMGTTGIWFVVAKRGVENFCCGIEADELILVVRHKYFD